MFFCLMALTIGARQFEEIMAIIAMVLGIYFLISIIVFAVVKLEITNLPQHNNELILLHYKNRVEIYKRPVWGKPLISKIKLPNEWLKDIKGGEQRIIATNLEIEMNNLVTVSIPLSIEYKFLGPFKVSDFQKKLKITVPRTKKIRFFSGLNIFKPVIEPSYRESMKMDIIRLNNGQLSQLDLAQIIVAKVDFPEKYFSNLKKIKIEIGSPRLIIILKK